MKNFRGNGKLTSFQVIGDEMGVSKVTASKICDKAIAKIKVAIERYDEETQALILDEIFQTKIFTQED